MVSTRATQKAFPVSFLTVSIWFWAASPAFCLTSSTMFLKAADVGEGDVLGELAGLLVGIWRFSGRILLAVLITGSRAWDPRILGFARMGARMGLILG